MESILRFIADKFDLNVLILFLISSFFLIFIDGKEYKKKDLKREYKFSRNSGIFFVVFGFIMFIAAKMIHL
jgi:hypothetical protein